MTRTATVTITELNITETKRCTTQGPFGQCVYEAMYLITEGGSNVAYTCGHHFAQNITERVS